MRATFGAKLAAAALTGFAVTAIASKGGKVAWASHTSGAGVVTTMQKDGNLVITDADGTPLWSTGTASPGAVLGVRNDGNVVVLSKANKVVWALN